VTKRYSTQRRRERGESAENILKTLYGFLCAYLYALWVSALNSICPNEGESPCIS